MNFYRMKEKITIWLVWCLPKYLVMWCYYRVAAHASSGKWGNDGVPDITMMDAIERWGQPNHSVKSDPPSALESAG